VEIKFHKRVQVDLDTILDSYDDVSFQLGDDFFTEFQICLGKVARNPKYFHFDHSGLRRCNLDRFPYHFLYDINNGFVRVWVLRHNSRRPKFGLRRFIDKPKQ
jgi:hypothetical protein